MGQNIFVAGYREFQLGTGSKANVPTTNVKATLIKSTNSIVRALWP